MFCPILQLLCNFAEIKIINYPAVNETVEWYQYMQYSVSQSVEAVKVSVRIRTSIRPFEVP